MLGWPLCAYANITVYCYWWLHVCLVCRFYPHKHNWNSTIFCASYKFTNFLMFLFTLQDLHHLLPQKNLHSFHFFMIYVKSTIWLACGFYKICSFWLTWWFCSTSFVFFTTRFNPGHYSNYLWKCSHLCLCAILLCLISRWPDQYLWMITTLIDLRETKYPQ